MFKPRALLLWMALCVLGSVLEVCAQQRDERVPWEMEALTDDGWVEMDLAGQTALATNWVGIRYSGAVLTAERVGANYGTGDVEADGTVRIQQGDQIWASEHIRYNFFTRKIEAQQFRTGKAPVFA